MTHDHFSIKLSLLFQEYRAQLGNTAPTFEGFMQWVSDAVANLKQP